MAGSADAVLACGLPCSVRVAVLLLMSSGAVARQPVIDDVTAASGVTQCRTTASSGQSTGQGNRGSSFMQIGVLTSMALSVDANQSAATSCSTLRWTGDKCLDVSGGNTRNGNNIQLR